MSKIWKWLFGGVDWLKPSESTLASGRVAPYSDYQTPSRPITPTPPKKKGVYNKSIEILTKKRFEIATVMERRIKKFDSLEDENEIRVTSRQIEEAKAVLFGIDEAIRKLSSEATITVFDIDFDKLENDYPHLKAKV